MFAPVSAFCSVITSDVAASRGRSRTTSRLLVRRRAFRSSRCSRSHWRLCSGSLYGMDSVLPFPEKLKYFRQGARFHALTPANQHDGLAVCFRGAGCLPNANFEDSFSEYLIGNRLSVAVFRALEVHQTRIVPLFPSPTRFFPERC
jgi:hypothetical protein